MNSSMFRAAIMGAGMSVMLAGAALADPLVIVVVDPQGNGVSVFTNDTITDAEYSLITGIDVPPEAPGQNVLVLEEGKNARWTNDTIDEIDRHYGGDGAPPSRDLNKSPNAPGEVIDLTRPPSGSKAIEIFDEDDAENTGNGPEDDKDNNGNDQKSGDDDGTPNVSSGIELKSGNWQISPGETVFEGCGAKLPGQIRSAMPNISGQVKAFTFSRPFNPQTDMDFYAPLLVLWSQTSPSEWFGFVELPENGGAQAGVEFGISMEMDLISPTEIDILSLVEVHLSSFAAKLLESSQVCKASTPGILRYVGS